MQNEATFTLNLSPQDSLRVLEKTVMARFNWRIMTGGKPDQPRFLIEKQVQYSVLRGWSLPVLYQIAGSFQPGKNGETILQYTVSGQSGVPLLLASTYSVVLLLMACLIGMIAFSPPVSNRLTGVLLVGFILTCTGLYGLFAYRSYQGHLQELHHFMKEFAQARASG